MTYINRMKDEAQELEARALQLEHFMDNKEKFYALSVNQRGLMALQLHLMAMYMGTLEERIELAEEEQNDDT